MKYVVGREGRNKRKIIGLNKVTKSLVFEIHGIEEVGMKFNCNKHILIIRCNIEKRLKELI